MAKIETLKAPAQRLLYTEPLTEITADKKNEIKTCKDTFIFILSAKQPNILFLQCKANITRLSKLLKHYTQEEHINQQFRKLLKEPTIIQDKQTTLIIIETIYIFSFLLNIDLTEYIYNNDLEYLTTYYFTLYIINKHKRDTNTAITNTTL